MSIYEIVYHGLVAIIVIWSMCIILNSIFNKRNNNTLTYYHFNVREAALCVQCETIFCRRMYKQCPSCANESIYIIGTAFKTNDVCPHVKKQGEMMQ
jgi:hypothetical protein